MFTKNWYEVAVLYLERNSEARKTNCPNIVTVGGTVFSSMSGYSAYCGLNPMSNLLASVKTSLSTDSFVDDSTTNMGSGIVFGTGNTPATPNDIKLSGDIVSGISVSIVNNDVRDPNYYEWNKVYTITNSNSTEITIGEIGMFLSITNQKQQYGTTYYHPYLIERTALETPIIIPADGVGQVTYTIRMDYPTA